MAISALHLLRYADCGREEMTWREVTAWSLYVLALSVTVAHQIWLLDTHIIILQDFKFSPVFLGYVHAIPTYIPVLVFFLAFVAVSCSNESCRSPSSKQWPNFRPGVGAGLLAAGSTSLLTYPIQIIIYLCIDVILYMRALPSNAMCWCWRENSLTLLNSAMGFLCECYIPYYGFVKFPTHNASLIDGSSLTELGYQTTHNVSVSIVPKTNGTSIEDTMNTWYTTNFKTLLLLLQSCVIITVLRLPVYLFLQQLNFSDRKSEADKDIHQRANEITSRASTKQSALQRLVKLHVEQVRLERQLGRAKRLSLHLVIELCYFNFVEGLDAFTLVEDIIHYADYFKGYWSFTTAVLAFVSITIFIVTTSNIISLFPEGLNRYSKHTKLFVVVLGNLPFLIIRSYLSYLAGGLQNREMSSIFLMFVVKEVLVLLMGIVEFFMELYADDGDEDKAQQQVNPGPPGFKNRTLSVKDLRSKGETFKRAVQKSLNREGELPRQQPVNVTERNEDGKEMGIINESFKADL